eukprot:gene13400-19250_t
MRTALSSCFLLLVVGSSCGYAGGHLQSSPQPTSLTVSAAGLADQLNSTCHLGGAVDDCCNCTYQSVGNVNQDVVFPIVEKLVKTAFFRYFKVNVYCECPLWPDDSMCALEACSVCECDADEVPKPWLLAENQAECVSGLQSEESRVKESGSCNTSSCAVDIDSKIDREVEADVHAGLLNLKGWRGFNNPWIHEGENDEEYLYVNLLANPERYTGYQGEHAHRIWSGIYGQACFTTEFLNTCEESRVFYRLISGMHASISAHLSAKYLLSENSDGTGVWGPSYTEFANRLGNEGVRYRVQNLYFAYLFVLRAVMKAGPLLENFSYVTGIAEEDAMAAQLIQELTNKKELWDACPMPFDEGRLWKGSDADDLRAQVQDSFRNITRLMDCVGCEKCKLWGKLQTLGIATALKVLFSSSDCDGQIPNHGGPSSSLKLERNEVIALINLLERFSTSIEIYRSMSAGMHDQSEIENANDKFTNIFNSVLH